MCDTLCRLAPDTYELGSIYVQVALSAGCSPCFTAILKCHLNDPACYLHQAYCTTGLSKPARHWAYLGVIGLPVVHWHPSTNPGIGNKCCIDSDLKQPTCLVGQRWLCITVNGVPDQHTTHRLVTHLPTRVGAPCPVNAHCLGYLQLLLKLVDELHGAVLCLNHRHWAELGART